MVRLHQTDTSSQALAAQVVAPRRGTAHPGERNLPDRIRSWDTLVNAKEVVEGPGCIVPSSRDPRVSYMGRDGETCMFYTAVQFLLWDKDAMING
jgi:hypothetical protein